MDADRTTIPSAGVMHRFPARDGTCLALLTVIDGTEHTLVSGEPFRTVVPELGEPARFTEYPHSTSIPDRVTRLERRIHDRNQ